MIVGIKDAAKLVEIMIIVCCAVLVCTLFTNYYMDLKLVESLVEDGQMRILYDAQLSTAVVVCLLSGGCLMMTSVVMLFFYIKHYVDTHKKELGILKALGYSNMKVAKSFWVFGIGVLIGSVAGFGGAWLIMPAFYDMQNKENILPDTTMSFNLEIIICFVILPTLVFAAIAVIYAFFKLKRPVLALLRDSMQDDSKKPKKYKDSKKESGNFVEELKRSTLRSRKTLVFFIFFSALCFSAMTQMAAGTKDLASEMMSAMVLLIGIVLACTILLLAITTVIKGNVKTIAMMRVFGYGENECSNALISVYRPVSYIGFAVGTLYQYGLLKLAVEVLFKDMEGVPEYNFDYVTMFISLVCFVAFYEIVMYCYSKKIKKISVKEIMIE